MISVMLQYMICKSIQHREQSSSKFKMFIWISLHHDRYWHECRSLCMIICHVDIYAWIHMKYINSCSKQYISHKFKTKYKTWVKQRCADSKTHTVVIYHTWKLHKLYNVREYCCQEDMSPHKCMNQLTRSST